MAGLRVGQAYGVFHRPGFGLLVSVPRSLSTQPPFATQALTNGLCPKMHQMKGKPILISIISATYSTLVLTTRDHKEDLNL